MDKFAKRKLKKYTDKTKQFMRNLRDDFEVLTKDYTTPKVNKDEHLGSSKKNNEIEMLENNKTDYPSDIVINKEPNSTSLEFIKAIDLRNYILLENLTKNFEALLTSPVDVNLVKVSDNSGGYVLKPHIEFKLLKPIEKTITPIMYAIFSEDQKAINIIFETAKVIEKKLLDKEFSEFNLNNFKDDTMILNVTSSTSRKALDNCSQEIRNYVLNLESSTLERIKNKSEHPIRINSSKNKSKHLSMNI